ncbi:MAG: peptide chain release factor N(5)-glutamine methyltransferase [Candidatus Accumulibacter sp.]|nr:peptide chain release factor N(5)-glutamine methyltransferase [Accumulibacter sp.]
MSVSADGRIDTLWRRAGERVGRADARFLLERVSGLTHAALLASPERELPLDLLRRFESLVERRAAGEPLAYLLGSAWFCGLEFAVNPSVLIPRPETEILVRRAAGIARAIKRPRILDMGAGTGIIAITMAKYFPGAEVTAADISLEALGVACSNAARHGVNIRFVESDWFSGLAGEHFNLLLSNPPYVANDDPHLQENGLPYEPRHALTDGIKGGDGLACIRKLIRDGAGHLSDDGYLLLEHGYDQAARVHSLLMDSGYSGIRGWRDAAGIERVSEARLAPEISNGYTLPDNPV